MASVEPVVELLAPNIPMYTYRASTSGATVILEAGIHGDEIAGIHALQEFIEDGVDISAGVLHVVPVMNPAAYRARQRVAPGGLDMNRCFPGDSTSNERERRLAGVFMELMRRVRPAVLATMHESHKKYDPNVTPSFGQSIVYGVKPEPALVTDLVAQLNKRVRDESEHWAAQYYPVATSSTEIIVDAIGCTGICTETWMGFPEQRRIELNKQIIEEILALTGLTRR